MSPAAPLPPSRPERFRPSATQLRLMGSVVAVLLADILSWTYRRIVEISRSQGVLPVWIFIPTLEYPLQEEKVAHLTRLAEEAGFVILDLSPAYDNQDPESLVVAYWDKHPNAKGHRLIAEDLYLMLQERPAEIPLFQGN